MNSGIHSALPPDVSGALRYERVAQLEAVLELRDNKRRANVWTLVITGLVAAAACVTWLVW